MKTTGKLIGVQHLRALAAAAVVAHHDWPRMMAALGRPIHSPFGIGAAGVDVFFVISGFIMMQITAERESRPLDFFAHRVLRIAPLYWIFTVIAFLMIRYDSFFMSGAGGIAPLVKSMLFIPTDLRPGDAYPVPLIPVGWTLVLEMGFYLLLSISLFAGRSYVLVATALLVALFTIAYGLGGVSGIAFYGNFNGIILEFLLGILLAYAIREADAILPVIGIAAVVVGIAAMVWLVGRYGFRYRLVTAGMPAMLVVGGAVIAEPLFNAPAFRRLVIFGDASYALYLAHLFVIFPVTRAIAHLPSLRIMNPWLAFWLLFILCVAAGVAVHLAVERPIQRLVHRLLKPAAIRTAV